MTDEHRILGDGPLPDFVPPPRNTLGGRRRIYDSDWITLDLQEVETATGLRYDHHVVGVPYHSVGVVVTHPEFGVLTNLRYRFTTDTTGLEIPGGGADPGEPLADAGAREVMEETGWSITEPELLFTTSTSDGNSSAEFSIFTADAVERVSDPTDLDELAPLYWLPPSRIPEVIVAGLVPCAFTLSALTTAWTLGRFQTTDPSNN